jgi:hypothetical protein
MYAVDVVLRALVLHRLLALHPRRMDILSAQAQPVEVVAHSAILDLCIRLRDLVPYAGDLVQPQRCAWSRPGQVFSLSWS